MDQRRPVKKIFENEPEGSRRRGRPRLRQLEDVEKELLVMKIKKWRQKAANREELACIIKGAKVLRELLSYGVWCMVYGVWFMVCGVWFMVCGV
jgi:hypothetical protein